MTLAFTDHPYNNALNANTTHFAIHDRVQKHNEVLRKRIQENHCCKHFWALS